MQNRRSRMDRNNNPSGGEAVPGQNPILDYYKRWSEKTALCVRSTTLLLIVLYILSWFIELDRLFANIPAYTIGYFEIYRLVLSPLVGDSIINLIVIIMWFPMMASNFESSMGSAYFSWLMLMITLLTNIGFCAICFTLWLFGVKYALFMVSHGFFVVLFGLLTIDCWTNPDAPRQLCCLPYNIPSKYFPVVLWLVFSLLSQSPSIDFGLAILIGVMYATGRLDRIRPNSQTIQRLEQEGGWLHTLSRAPGWVLAGTLGHDAWMPVNQIDPDAPESSHGQQQDTGPSTRSFGGISGFGLPDDSDGVGSTPAQMFPGSGNRLASGSGGGSSTATSNPMQFSSFLGGGREVAPAAVSSVVPSRQDLADKRMAALQGKQQQN
jgi:membrane associated rhomboid family serine protease